MIAGTATVFIWHGVIKPLGGVFAIYELLPAFIISALAIVVVSLMTAPPSAAITDVFDHYMDDDHSIGEMIEESAVSLKESNQRF